MTDTSSQDTISPQGTTDDAPLHLHYAINVALPGVHLRTEQWNSRMFYEMEEKVGVKVVCCSRLALVCLIARVCSLALVCLLACLRLIACLRLFAWLDCAAHARSTAVLDYPSSSPSLSYHSTSLAVHLVFFTPPCRFLTSPFRFLNPPFQALPMYRLMALSIARLTSNDIPGTLRALTLAHTLLRAVLRFFYDNLKDENLSTPLWMAYCQGFHGWTLDGVDGVSGGLSLVIRVLDSFLGIRPFPSEEVEALHLPLAQRNWLNYLREFDIRRVARERGEMEVVDVLEKMVAQLRVSSRFFPRAHRSLLSLFLFLALLAPSSSPVNFFPHLPLRQHSQGRYGNTGKASTNTLPPDLAHGPHAPHGALRGRRKAGAEEDDRR